MQPGAIGSRFAMELARRDLAFPAGHCPSVALGGYLLSGGLGWNSGLWGVGCASVLEITVVTADGAVLRCTEEEHPGLFWAARGAGPGFFAVVTGFRLRLQRRPTALATTSYVFPLAAVGPVADWATETARELPRAVLARNTASWQLPILPWFDQDSPGSPMNLSSESGDRMDLW
ncbi:FAD-binding protein [Streptomyces sp. NPDC052043]|uniref:FAD-binding protein n=1 Tax=Streptomyces sp. NPDC052043 TaxID=3365684 RepID=UPI0037CFFC4A